MSILLLLKGILLGFSIAAPVGPVGVLCIRRTLAHGRASGFLSGLGAATADGIYAGVAGFGLTAITGFFIGFRWFLLSLGISTLRRQFNPTLLVWVNRTSGVVVLAFGVFALI